MWKPSAFAQPGGSFLWILRQSEEKFIRRAGNRGRKEEVLLSRMNKPVPLVAKDDPEHPGTKENQGEEEAHYFQILLPFLHPPGMI